MSGVFKAYDIRGVYPDELDEKLAYAVGFHFRSILDADDLARGDRVVVSHDMRSSSPSMADALCDGLRAAGLSVVHIGLATTPMNYFATGYLRASGGIQVTASHNPAKYNGLKLSRRDAIPVSSDSGIGTLEALVHDQPVPRQSARAPIERRDISGAYREHVLGFVREWEPRLKVAVDVANGMATLYRGLLEELNIELVPLFFGLDGTFPNHEANPLKPENLRDLQNAVRDQGCALGIAFDGDADRAIPVDDRCAIVGADMVTALLARPMLERFPGAPIVYDIRSSWATREEILAAGGQPVRERVGHSFMKATMRRIGSPFGGELAGHFYYRENYFADSAIITAIEILNVIRRTGKALSELLAPLRRYAGTGEVNFHVADKAAMIRHLAEVFHDGAIDYLDGITVEYTDWWFNVRPSNTEPLLRLVMEARTPELLERGKSRVLAILGSPEAAEGRT
ncbi:MAG TPA: phosphomannomutase/phosphoglucomutase [Thermoanaerobaculaceae bacterium]|nr:phosphomannomutase/phosphoglucomutase [Thermoanaerobaculaceae bacterium]